MDTALVIIDVQNDYFPQGKCELFQSEQALKVTKRLLEHFRERKLPIFYVQHISPEDAAFFLPNTKGVQLHKEIEPLGSEYIIVKHTPNGFHETTLQEKLTSLSIKNLVMCGMMTHMCVDTTVRAAKDLGHLVTLISDACATKDLEWNGRKLPQIICCKCHVNPDCHDCTFSIKNSVLSSDRTQETAPAAVTQNGKQRL